MNKNDRLADKKRLIADFVRRNKTWSTDIHDIGDELSKVFWIQWVKSLFSLISKD